MILQAYNTTYLVVCCMQQLTRKLCHLSTMGAKFIFLDPYKSWLYLINFIQFTHIVMIFSQFRRLLPHTAKVLVLIEQTQNVVW